MKLGQKKLEHNEKQGKALEITFEPRKHHHTHTNGLLRSQWSKCSHINIVNHEGGSGINHVDMSVHVDIYTVS